MADDLRKVVCIEDELEDEMQAEEKYSSSNGKSSLILDLKVKNDVFSSDESLEEQLGGFIEKIISKSNGQQLFPDKEVTAVLVPGERGKLILYICIEDVFFLCPKINRLSMAKAGSRMIWMARHKISPISSFQCTIDLMCKFKSI